MKNKHRKKKAKGRRAEIAFGSAADKMLGTHQPHPDHTCTSALAILKRKRAQALQQLGHIDAAIREIRAVR